jgi:uncharacterized damage-inducible protein DinB
MDAHTALVESWRRQAQCLTNLLTLVTPDLLEAKTDQEGWPVAVHLSHIHQTRIHWLEQVLGRDPGLPMLFTEDGDRWVASRDLDAVRAALKTSEDAIAAYVEASRGDDAPAGGYDHPLLFLQHMVWHEGYHFGLLALVLRANGREPTEEWEEANVWGLWRVE